MVFEVAFLFAVASGPDAGCCVTIREPTKFYEVRGLTRREVDRDLRQRAPNDPANGRTAAALTLAEFDYRTSYLMPASDDCSVEKTAVTVRIQYTMPRWRDRAAASPDLKRDWDRFEAQLRAHEERHAEIAIASAKAAADQILSLRDRRDCDRLNAEVQKVIRRRNEAADRAHDELDARTEAGIEPKPTF